MGKVAGWDEYDKKGLGQLRDDGFDTIELDGDVAVLNKNFIRILGVQQIGKKEHVMTASENKCKVIRPPEVFDFKQPPEPPVVFLGGAIDMGQAEDWQSKLAETLDDVSCVLLNPRRNDWDSSWEQSIHNPQFKEQVEWELKGLEQATFVVIVLPKDSKAPISLLELGLHVIGRRMIVFCQEGYWRKGNVDVVCNRYGVPVYEDFDSFATFVKARILETTAGAHEPEVLPEGTVQQQKQHFVVASDRMAWRIMAREFVIGTKEVRVASNMSASKNKKVVCPDCGQMVGVRLVPGGGSWNHFITHMDRKGDHCKGSGWSVPKYPDKEEWGKQERVSSRSRYCSVPRYCDFYKAVNGKWYMNLANDEDGGYRDSETYGPFESLDSAKKYLHNFSNPGSYRTDDSGKKSVPTHSPNGRPVQKPESRTWSSKMMATMTVKEGDICNVSGHTEAEADPMAGENLTSLFLTLQSWATRKANSLHFGAPVALQILDRLDDVETALKGKMGLRGREAVIALLKAMKGCFTMDAQPIPALIHRYGVDAIRECAGRRSASVESGMGDTHPFGSPLRGRPDYGERDGEVGEKYGLKLPSEGIMTSEDKNMSVTAETLRVRVIADRIASMAKEFLGSERWDGEIQGQHIRFQWVDRSERQYRLTEMPMPGKKRLRVRSGGFPAWLGGSQKREYGFLLMANVAPRIKASMTYEQAASEIDKRMKELVAESNDKSSEPKQEQDLISGPWETLVFYLEVEPADMKPFVVDAKDFKVSVGWDKFEAYDPSSIFEQSDPFYTKYQSKSPTAARKMYKVLNADPDALKNVSWSDFGGWMRRSGISYDSHSSQWH
jgi:hypothetical protein